MSCDRKGWECELLFYLLCLDRSPIPAPICFISLQNCASANRISRWFSYISYICIILTRWSLRLYFRRFFYHKCTRRFHHASLRCIELLQEWTAWPIHAPVAYQVVPYHFLFWRWAISTWYRYFNSRIWHSHFLLYLYTRIVFEHIKIGRSSINQKYSCNFFEPFISIIFDTEVDCDLVIVSRNTGYFKINIREMLIIRWKVHFE